MVKKSNHTKENLVCEQCEEIKTIRQARAYYICEECNMGYADKKVAEECEAFCKKHKSCNLELMKKACKTN